MAFYVLFQSVQADGHLDHVRLALSFDNNKPTSNGLVMQSVEPAASAAEIIRHRVCR